MTSLEFAELLQHEDLNDQQIAKLYEHYCLLERWNQKMNLTTVKSGVDMVTRHYLESLFFARHLPEDPATLADIGSGPGFPGVPIAVVNPNCRVTLVESHQKKAVFLSESTRGLSNISVTAKRAQDIASSFDWIVARAVDPEEVVALVPRLSTKIGLMVGEEDFLHLKTDPRIAWREPVRLPWGDRRLCVYGST